MENQIPSVAPAPPVPPTPWFKISLIIIGVLIVLGLFGNIYLLARNQKPAAEITPTPTQAAVIPTPDLTADWKTLTDKSEKFSVKYKEGWYEPISEILIKNTTGSLQEWLASRDNQEKQDPLCKDCFKVYSEKERMIANYPAIIREVSSHPAGRVLRAYILLNKNEIAYIETCCGDPSIPLSKERLGQFDQILSTFKFLDQNQAVYTEDSRSANWKIFQSSDLTFKYPPDWTKSGDFTLVSVDPKIRLVVIPKGNTLMNECMMETSVETKASLTIKRFSRVTTGAMCETTDATPREIWVIPSPDAYDPGISYEYLSTQGAQAESIFDQTLSTFKFLQ